MYDIIKTILNSAINAPSGDNSQPWQFNITKENILEIFNTPDADNEMYNFKQRGSYIAHGALIQNIILLAGFHGLDPQINYFPNPQNLDLIAHISFFAKENKTSSLKEFIQTRCTNRKPYKNEALPETFYQAINSLSPTYGIYLHLIKNQEKIQKIAEALSLNEKLILENFEIHKQIFRSIRWTQKEEIQTKSGLFIRTLELNPGQEFAFKLFKKWKILKFLNHFKIANLVAKDSQKLYQASACFGLLTVPDLKAETFLNCGKFFQLIWLTAAKFQISLQPTAALLYLNQRIKEGSAEDLTAEQRKAIIKSNNTIESLFEINGQIPAMLFRLGFSQNPSATSLKKLPVYKNEK